MSLKTKTVKGEHLKLLFRTTLEFMQEVSCLALLELDERQVSIQELEKIKTLEKRLHSICEALP